MACATGTDDGSPSNLPPLPGPGVDAGVGVTPGPAPDGGINGPADAGAGVDGAVVTAPDAGTVGCTSTNLNLLANPSFDEGSNGKWTEVSGGGYDLVTSDASDVSDSGAYVAWLGGYPSGVDELWQNVAVPAGATNLVLSGKIMVATDESSGAWDIADLQIRDSGGSVQESVRSWSNADDDGTLTWKSFSKSLADYSGQTVRVYMRSQTDSSLDTSFLLDTMALTATVCN